MGKSLSILALITKTIEDAHKWVADPASFPLTMIDEEKQPSRATLVVVSSAPKYPKEMAFYRGS